MGTIIIKNTPTGTLFTDLVDETIEAVLENGGDVEFCGKRVFKQVYARGFNTQVTVSE